MVINHTSGDISRPRSNYGKFILGIFFVLIVANGIAWKIVYDLFQVHALEVHFFAVGQGDAILIETPGRHQILIDGGPNSTILEKLGKEMPFWDRTIDLIILTHPEYDHLSGLNEVLRRYEVENVLWTGIQRETAEYNEWLDLINKEKANIILAKAGQQIKAENVIFYIIYPFESLEDKIFKDSNNTSIITRLLFGKITFLFAGDNYEKTETEVLEKLINIDSDVFKVSHHGSKTSNSEEFISKISPEIAVISVGKDNSYGHPHQEVLDTLLKYGIKVLRTDMDGDIEIISDGKQLKIK